MATNPKLPREPEHERDSNIRGTGTPRRPWWPPILIVIAIAVLIGLIVWVVHRPARTTGASPREVSGSNVVLSDLRSGVPVRSGEIDETGNLLNQNHSAVTGVTVDATFKNGTGQGVETLRQELGPAQSETTGFTNDPVAAGASRAFSIHFHHVPEGWNGKLPELRIVQVQTAGGK